MVKHRLSYSLGDKTQIPNKELAVEIANSENKNAINELEQLVVESDVKRIKMDAIMTLAYVAELNPKFMVASVDFFIGLLNHPVERVGWGSMIGLFHVAALSQLKVYDNLSKVLDAMERDSIVGRDHGFKILVILYQHNQLRDDVYYLMLEQIRKVRPNQLGQYAERMMEVVIDNHKLALIETLEEKRLELSNPYHLNRLSKNLKKLYKQL